MKKQQQHTTKLMNSNIHNGEQSLNFLVDLNLQPMTFGLTDLQTKKLTSYSQHFAFAQHAQLIKDTRISCETQTIQLTLSMISRGDSSTAGETEGSCKIMAKSTNQ